MLKFERVESRSETSGQLLWFLGWLGVALVACFLHASPLRHGTHTELGLPPCASVLLFGRPCPGCGLTTSFTALAHGQILDAFRAHPFGPIMFTAYTVSAWAAIWGWRKGLKMNTDTKQLNTALIVFLVLFLAFGIYRFATTTGLGWEYGPRLSSTASR